MYADLIKTELLPQLTHLAAKYAVWWSFQPGSLLKTFLDDRNIKFDKYFRPEELLEQVLNTLSNLSQFSNNNVIVLDKELQLVFDSWFIFIPDIIKTNLLPHVVQAPMEIANDLQNEHMINNFYVETSYDIVYKDPSSVFWLNPVIDFAIHKSTGNVNQWNNLLFIFTEFCTNNKFFFTRHNDTIIGIRNNTTLTHLFDFKYFHISQIETILKKTSKFLGRKNDIIQNCSFLKDTQLFNKVSTDKYTNVFTFIDYVINNNKDLLPPVTSALYI